MLCNSRRFITSSGRESKLVLRTERRVGAEDYLIVVARILINKEEIVEAFRSVILYIPGNSYGCRIKNQNT